MTDWGRARASRLAFVPAKLVSLAKVGRYESHSRAATLTGRKQTSDLVAKISALAGAHATCKQLASQPTGLAECTCFE